MYSSLHNHTFFSLLDGYASPEEYLIRANEIGLKAFAITEHGNEYSWCYFDKLKNKYPDIKIIYGVEFYECDDVEIKDKSNKYYHLIVLAKNENGRKAINKLVTRSNFEGFYSRPRVELEWFKEIKCENDIVVSSACLASKIAKESDYNKCIEYINEYKSIFPYFYLEMQSHSHIDQIAYNQKILQLSQDTNTPYIITTDSHASTENDLYYQGRHVQIAHDSETMNELYEGCYLQSDEEIHNIMDDQIGYENVCIGLNETNNISDLIEYVNMPFQNPQLPTYPLPKGFNNNYEYIKHLINEGWKKRKFDEYLTQSEIKNYKERIDYELGVIHQMGFDGYFIIVWDLINWCKRNNIIVGDGRGSAAGSLVCFTLGITDIDPIKYKLIFERFLNPERISMPDIDIDLSDRNRAINYLVKKFGENNVCQIINFSYITPVVAIKDVGKILNFKYAEMDKLSKKFTMDTFQDCLDANPKLLIENPQYEELIDIASHLSGRAKTVSCHAGGVGIVDTDISDYMAMKLGSKGEHIIQVDKRIIEEIGIIKFDLLGVRTLKVVNDAKNTAKITDWDININNPIFEHDQKSYELLGKALTNGVFQVESAGMKDLLIRLKPNSLEDLSAIIALYRPDTMPYLEDYIKYKHNPNEITYIHPDMKPILESTYGCLLYQEQLMEIVRVFGGRTYGGADKFRKAIGKKDEELVKQEAEKLYQEIIDNGYDEKLARHISDEMKTKGGYLFNRSHSFCYAVLCFKTAYMKTYYPSAFFCALFNDNKDKSGVLNKYIIDAKLFNVTVLPPNINKSDIFFSIDENNNVLFGLSAISGIGETFANVIINERSTDYLSMNDFIERINPSKSQIVMLIKSGAFPTKNKRKSLIKYLKSTYTPLTFKEVQTTPSYRKLIDDWDINVELFRIGEKRFDYDKDKLLIEYNKKRKEKFDNEQEVRFKKHIEANKKYLENEEFWEFEALQIFITKNPFDLAYNYLPQYETVEIGEKCTIVGVIAKIQKKKDKQKKQFAFINIYSTFGLIEGIVWHTQLKEYEDLIKTGSQIALLVKKEKEENVVVQKIKPYNQWINEKRKEGVNI